MTKEIIIKDIINFIPSETLRKEIVKNNYEMKDLDILYFVSKYCKVYSIKIKCLKNMILLLEDKKILQFCKLLYQFECEKYNDFTKDKRRYIYEAIPYADEEGCGAMLFSKFKKAYQYIMECRDIELSSKIKKKYLDDEIPDFCYPDAGLEAEVIYNNKTDIINVKNYNIDLKFDVWANYLDFEMCDYKKHGIINGYYRPMISDIFKEGCKVKLNHANNDYIGYIKSNDLNSFSNPCYLLTDKYTIECNYEELEIIE